MYPPQHNCLGTYDTNAESLPPNELFITRVQ